MDAAADGHRSRGATLFPGVLGYEDPIAVTKDKIADTIVKDGFYTVDEICADDFAALCEEAGIQ